MGSQEAKLMAKPKRYYVFARQVVGGYFIGKYDGGRTWRQATTAAHQALTKDKMVLSVEIRELDDV